MNRLSTLRTSLVLAAVALALLTALPASAQTVCGTQDSHSLDTAACGTEVVDVVFVDPYFRVGIRTTTPQWPLEVADGEVAVSGVMPAGDGIQRNIGLGLAGRAPGEEADWRWRWFTADPDGGFGVGPRNLELWEYPTGDGTGLCCRQRLVIEDSYGRTRPPIGLFLAGDGSLGVGGAPLAAGLDVAGPGGIAVGGQPVISASGDWRGLPADLEGPPATTTRSECPAGLEGPCCGSDPVLAEHTVNQSSEDAVHCVVTGDDDPCEFPRAGDPPDSVGRCCLCGA